jgi:hypothetical protein
MSQKLNREARITVTCRQCKAEVNQPCRMLTHDGRAEEYCDDSFVHKIRSKDYNKEVRRQQEDLLDRWLGRY